MNKIIKNNKGAAVVLMVVMIVTGMLNIAIIASSIVSNGLVMNRAHINSTKAYYAAESGTERMLWKIRKTGPPAFDPTILTPGPPASPAWTDGRCAKDDLSNDLPCTNSNTWNDIVSNDTKYQIKYNFGGDPLDPAIFTTTGDYDDITKRVVQVQYYFK